MGLSAARWKDVELATETWIDHGQMYSRVVSHRCSWDFRMHALRMCDACAHPKDFTIPWVLSAGQIATAGSRT